MFSLLLECGSVVIRLIAIDRFFNNGFCILFVKFEVALYSVSSLIGVHVLLLGPDGILLSS